MPKKFQGENTKAQAARARKAALQNEKEEMRRKAEEDAYWADNDKHVKRKEQRKDEREKKKHDILEKKHASKALLQAEEEELHKQIKPQQQTAKLTRAQIQAHVEKQQEKERVAEKKKEAKTVHDDPLVENVNRLVIEGEEARTVDEALSVLSSKEPDLDRHPERRMKSAYLAYEEANMPRLKAENPGMRLSQLRNMLKKDWQKSPDNPLNQQHRAYNAKS